MATPEISHTFPIASIKNAGGLSRQDYDNMQKAIAEKYQKAINDGDKALAKKLLDAYKGITAIRDFEEDLKEQENNNKNIICIGSCCFDISECLPNQKKQEEVPDTVEVDGVQFPNPAKMGLPLPAPDVGDVSIASVPGVAITSGMEPGNALN